MIITVITIAITGLVLKIRRNRKLNAIYNFRKELKIIKQSKRETKPPKPSKLSKIPRLSDAPQNKGKGVGNAENTGLLGKSLGLFGQAKSKSKPHPQTQPDTYGTLIGHTGKRPIYIPDDAKHVFVCGTTGSGKTVALSNFIKRAIEQDYGALIIDGKGDTGQGSILDIIQTLKNNLNSKKKLYVINLSNPNLSAKYNPFKNSSPTVAKDMIINMTDWSEEHYKLNAERYMQRILQLLTLGNYDLSFQRIINCMQIDRFTLLSKKLVERNLITKEQYADNIKLAETSGKIAQSSIARFSTIAESEAGTIFSADGIDIAQALQEKTIILFILNPLTYPELSPAFGRLVLIDAKKAIGELFKANTDNPAQSNPDKSLMLDENTTSSNVNNKPIALSTNHPQINRTFFILDEITAYATTALTDLVNKSRSAGVTCILATQSLSDLDFACGDAYKEQIIENCNNYIVMRQNSGVNAEKWANILGTRATMEVTYQLQQRGLETSETGFGSARRVREFLYHPDDIKTLQTGKGFYLSRDMGFNSRVNINKPF